MKLVLKILILILMVAPTVSWSKAKDAETSCDPSSKILSATIWRNCIAGRKIGGHAATYEKLGDFKFSSQRAFMPMKKNGEFVLYFFHFSPRGGFTSSINFVGHNSSITRCVGSEVFYSRGSSIKTYVKMDEKNLFLRTQIPGAELSIVCRPESLQAP